MLSSKSALHPDAKCSCGHDRRLHFGNDGPCIAAHTLASGKLADKTVCPCVRFVERAD